MEGCCSIQNAPSIMASIVVAAVGLFLLTKAIDDWQLQRVRRRQHPPQDSRPSGPPDPRESRVESRVP